MMKFRMQVQKEDANGALVGESWWEDYDKPGRDMHAVAQEIVDYFNRTLRPNENRRRLLAVEKLDRPILPRVGVPRREKK